MTTVLFTVAWGGHRSPGSVCECSRSECEHLRSLCERSRSECKRRVRSANTYVRSANSHVRSANAEFGLRTPTFAVRTLTFGVQTPSLVCDRCVRYANIYVRMQILKNHFFSYQISQLFIQLQGNKVLIDLGGRFHNSIAACSNNSPPHWG